MKKYFERLEKAGFIRRGKLQESAVINTSFPKVLDLLDYIASDTAEIDSLIRPSVHTHCASLGLGGARDECWESSCRIKEIDELARFAALYSDRVFIHNFLTDNAPILGHAPEEDSGEFRQELWDDILILLRIRPLIEKDVIVPYTPASGICPWCYAKRVFGSGADRRLDRAMKSLSHTLFEQMSVNAILDDYGFGLSFDTPADLFRHDTHVQDRDQIPPIISSKPRLMSRLRAGESVPLSVETRRKLGLHKIEANAVLASIRYQMSVAAALQTSFLIDRDVDMNILKYISRNDELEQRNRIAARHLQSMVPFVGDVPVSKLIQLRQREEESFIRFRSALDTAMKEVTAQKSSFTERDARSIYSDVIAPEIARLDQKVREAKRDLVKVPVTSAIATVAVIIFGLYSGMVPSELKEIASILGLTKVMYDTVSKTVEYVDAEKSIRPEKFYFLWKVKHQARIPQ
jgi:hypothetical protein